MQLKIEMGKLGSVFLCAKSRIEQCSSPATEETEVSQPSSRKPCPEVFP